ncbi:MAG: EpsG family protein [Fusobacteriaceae bacterium]
MIPYLLVYMILVLIGFLKIKKEYINTISATIIFLFMGLRYNVGWDYRWYFELALQNNLLEQSLFSNLQDLVIFEPNLFQYLRMEFLNRVIYKIVWYFENPQLIFMFYSFLLVFFIKKGLDNEKKYTIYPWLFFLGFPIFFFNYTSLMRQAVAVSIVFYSYKYFKNRSLLKFIATILLASLFHKTALFLIVLYIIPLLNIRYRYIIFIMLTSFVSISILKQILKLPIFSNYSIYIDTSLGEGGRIIYFLIIILAFIYLLIYKKILSKNETNRSLINIFLLGSYLYISLIDLGHLGPRMAQYFLIYILYTIDEILCLFKPQKIVKIVFIGINFIFILLTLYGDYIQERRQYIPYQINFFNREVEWKEL